MISRSGQAARAREDGSRGRAAETAARSARLLAAASALAADGGYEAVHMRAVARRAGVALGTLYRHFSSKDQLLVAVLADQADALRANLARRPARGDTAAARVTDVLDRATAALAREPRLAAAMVTALASTDPAAASAVAAVEERQRAMLADAIGTARSCGENGGSLDSVLRTLSHVWFSVVISWVAGKLDADGMGHDLAVAARLLLPT
jgi:AcrR family transcriptional regulator